MDKEFEDWLKTRPAIIQEMARAYPPGEYKITEDAPYGYSCPGTIVSLEAYSEDGTIRVSVTPENVLPAAIVHAIGIRASFTVPERPIHVYVQPRYLTSLTP